MIAGLRSINRDINRVNFSNMESCRCQYNPISHQVGVAIISSACLKARHRQIKRDLTRWKLKGNMSRDTRIEAVQAGRPADRGCHRFRCVRGRRTTQSLLKIPDTRWQPKLIREHLLAESER